MYTNHSKARKICGFSPKFQAAASSLHLVSKSRPSRYPPREGKTIQLPFLAWRLSFSRPPRPSPSDSRVIECTVIPTEQTATGLSSSIGRPRGRCARIESLRSLRPEASSRSLRNTRQDASMRARVRVRTYNNNYRHYYRAGLPVAGRPKPKLITTAAAANLNQD